MKMSKLFESGMPTYEDLWEQYGEIADIISHTHNQMLENNERGLPITPLANSAYWQIAAYFGHRIEEVND